MTKTAQDTNTAPIHAWFSNVQDGARFMTKMVNVMMEEGDKQVAEGVKMFNTMQEHAAANRAQSVKLWSEMVERGATMGQNVADQMAASWRMK
jgi:hypothetical protein